MPAAVTDRPSTTTKQEVIVVGPTGAGAWIAAGDEKDQRNRNWLPSRLPARGPDRKAITLDVARTGPAGAGANHDVDAGGVL